MKTQIWIDKIIGAEGLQRIERAVAKAEEHTSGEIVPVLVQRSAVRGHVSQYLSLLLLLVLIPFDHLVTSLWSQSVSFYWVLGLWFLIAVPLFFAIYRRPWLIRLLTPRSDLAFQVEQRALIEFYQTAMAKTRDKTGIMILASFLEHRVVVLAEESIAQKLPDTVWKELVATLTYEMRRGQIVSGFEQAINKCGDILAAHFPKKAGDRNEICNRLVVRGEI